MSTSASLYQASVYAHPCAHPSLNNSCERLLPAKKAIPQSKLRYSGPRTTAVQNRQLRSTSGRRRMASNGVTNAVEIEQKKSYGIGGAGNIRLSPISLSPRAFPPFLFKPSILFSPFEWNSDFKTGRPSEVIYPPRTNPDGTRRRSSVWSSITTISPSSSPDGKRTTLLNLFSRRGSTGPVIGDDGVEGYKDVNYGTSGKKDESGEH